MDTRSVRWRISSQQASERIDESFLAIARNNAGVWLPIDPHMFLTLRADEEAPRQYTYRAFVQGGRWHSLPNEYVRLFFTPELRRHCKANCGKPISCSNAGQAAPGGGEASDADVATAESAVVGPPIAYPQHENDYCVAYSAASGLHAAGNVDSAASVARLASQTLQTTCTPYLSRGCAGPSARGRESGESRARHLSGDQVTLTALSWRVAGAHALCDYNV